MHDLPISRVMSAQPLTAQPQDSLAATVEVMNTRGVHHMLVVEAGRLVGIMSSADLLKLALLLRPGETVPSGAGLIDWKVRDIMQRDVVSLPETATLRDALQTLMLGGFHALPVVAADGQPRGIVTCADLGALLLEQVERSAQASGTASTSYATGNGAVGRLLEVLKCAEIYLHSGQSEQQHARLLRAVNAARESTSGRPDTLGL